MSPDLLIGMQFCVSRKNRQRSLLQLALLRKFKHKSMENCGGDAMVRGNSAVGASAGVTKQLAYYCRRKLTDPAFHNGSRGGDRCKSFSATDAAWIEVTLWRLVKQDPTRTVRRLRDLLLLQRELELRPSPTHVPQTYLCGLLHKWHWRYATTT